MTRPQTSVALPSQTQSVKHKNNAATRRRTLNNVWRTKKKPFTAVRPPNVFTSLPYRPNRTRSQAPGDVSDCLLCVYNNQTEPEWRYVWWHTCRHHDEGPIIFPNQENQNKLGCAALPVCHHYKSSSRPQNMLERNSTTTGPGRMLFVPNIYGWYTVRRVPFTHIYFSHTYCVPEWKHCKKPQPGGSAGFFLGLALWCFLIMGFHWLWTSIRPISVIVYCHCENVWSCRKIPKQRSDSEKLEIWAVCVEYFAQNPKYPCDGFTNGWANGFLDSKEL